jgi:hypothetical protein
MAILAQEKILTLDNWKPASKLEVGDYVFDRKGQLVKVKLIQQYVGQDCYEVTLSDHLSISGDGKLELPIETPKYRKRIHEYKGKLQFRRPLRPTPVQDIASDPLVDRRNRKLYSIPTTNPLKLPHKDLPVPPFVFGFWFFARRSTGKLAAARGTTDYVLEKFRDYGYKTKKHAVMTTGEYDFSVFPSIPSQLIPNIPKVIPTNYLLASEEQRIELLFGIICAKNRQFDPRTQFFRFCSRQYDTARRVQMLAESIGCTTSMEYNKNKKDYTVKFQSRTQLHPDHTPAPLKVHYGRRYVREINSIPAQMCVHIETTGDDNTILVGEGFIPCL